jgi:hypothetical protein
MKTPRLILADMRKAKIERLLSTPPRGFLVSPLARRLLAVIAVVFSYLYLFALALPNGRFGEDSRGIFDQYMPEFYVFDFTGVENSLIAIYDIIGWAGALAPLVLLISFIVLRKSMSRVTSLPDEFLDEREVANRDWAFRTGYLVVRRIGLVVALGLFVVSILGYTPGSGKFSIHASTVFPVAAFNAYLVALTANDAIGFYLNVIGLLAFVAYSFPLILLAWREAKFPESAPQPKRTDIIENPKEFARAYFRKLLNLVSFTAGLFLVLILGSPFGIQALGNWMTFRGGTFVVVFAIVGYGLYSYLWASVKTVQILVKTARNKINHKVNSIPVIGTYLFFVITQGLGIAMLLGLSRVINQPELAARENTLGAMVLFGIAMIPAQLISFFFIRRLKLGSLEA